MMPPSHGLSDLPDPEKTRRRVGLVLFLLGNLVGFGLLVLFLVILPLLSPQVQFLRYCLVMLLGAVLAFPAAAVYLTVPRLLDRYDPEPAFALIGCLCWGAIAACGFSLVINTFVGEVALAVAGADVATVVGAVLSAPFVEEFWKGVGLVGVFYFLRREFDGVVDGIIYATFIAIGFAAVENVIYYARAVSTDQIGFAFLVRGVLAPWGHPLYTAMTGIGFGIARETTKSWVRWVAPLVGYGGAVVLHMIWNGAAVLFGTFEDGRFMFYLSLVLWLMFVTAFLIMVIVLVRRREKIIRANLLDEVALKTIDLGELELVCSAFGLMKARIRYGKKGSEFVRAVARLALSKWHTTRAIAGSTHTVSMDFIGPLRARIRELRAGLAASQSVGQ